MSEITREEVRAWLESMARPTIIVGGDVAPVVDTTHATACLRLALAALEDAARYQALRRAWLAPGRVCDAERDGRRYVARMVRLEVWQPADNEPTDEGWAQAFDALMQAIAHDWPEPDCAAIDRARGGGDT